MASAISRSAASRGSTVAAKNPAPPPCPGRTLVASAQAALVKPAERDLGLPPEQPADNEVAQRQQQPGRVQADPVDLARPARGCTQEAVHRGNDGLDVVGCPGQRRSLRLQPAVAVVGCGELPHLPQQLGQGGALVADDLAEVQVHALDRGGALVQAVDLGVPDVLLDRVVLQVTGAAERLQRLGQLLVTALRADPLNDRQQQVVERGRGSSRSPLAAASWTASCWLAVYRTSARMPSA